MIIASRYEHNPILSPVPHNPWEEYAAFNGSVTKKDNAYSMLYRAISNSEKIGEYILQLSTIGKAVSENGLDFDKRVQFIAPQEEWEKYGCEDPRVTLFESKYYIFYTALSTYPFGP